MKYSKHIFICTNEREECSIKGDCARRGSKEIRIMFVKLINEHGLKGKVRANKSGCLDVCELGPVVVIYPDEVWYTKVKLNDVDEIFNSNILNNKPVKSLTADKNTWNELQLLKEMES